MNYVLLTALGIALCSFFGAVIGFSFKRIPESVEDAVNGCAAGIMLAAAVLGLVVPSMEFSGDKALYIPTIGMFCGAAFLTLINRAGPYITKKMGMTGSDSDSNCRAMLFVLAIAIHHFPEGIAAGTPVSRGQVIAAAGDTSLVEVSGEPHLHYELMIDGVPVFDHELFMNYDPALVKAVEVYPSVYSFGDRSYEGGANFVTFKGNNIFSPASPFQVSSIIYLL